MDKRWLIIFIIFIVGIFSLFLVVENSTTVFKAVTVIGKTAVTLPEGYSIDSTSGNQSILMKNSQKIAVKQMYSGNNSLNEYNTMLDLMKKSGDSVDIKSNNINDIDGTKAYTIEYCNKTEDYRNYTIIYFDKCDFTYRVKATNYASDNSEILKDMNFIVETIKIDMKQGN